MNETTSAENGVPRCEGLAPFRCGNPACPAHGIPEAEDDAASLISSLRARLDAVSGLVDALPRGAFYDDAGRACYYADEVERMVRGALNGYVPTRPIPPANPAPTSEGGA